MPIGIAVAPDSQASVVVANIKKKAWSLMIGDVLLLIRERLNSYLSPALHVGAGDSAEERVLMLDGWKTDPIEFRSNAISVLLINIEQETSQRNAEPCSEVAGEGGLRRMRPEIQLNLYVLFVARYQDYAYGLNQLASIVRFVHQNRSLDLKGIPLGDQVDKLVLELVTLPLSAQNEIWNALRVGYHPSVQVRVRMAVFKDEGGAAVPKVKQVEFQKKALMP